MDKTIEILETAAAYYHDQLTHDNQYLYHKLLAVGITYQEIDAYGLGYAPGLWRDLYEVLSSAGYKDAELIRSGLYCRSALGCISPRLLRRIIIPVRDRRGGLSLAGRVPDDSLPTWVCTSKDTFGKIPDKLITKLYRLR